MAIWESNLENKPELQGSNNFRIMLGDELTDEVEAVPTNGNMTGIFWAIFYRHQPSLVGWLADEAEVPPLGRHPWQG